MSIVKRLPVWLICWLISVLVAEIIRPALAVDETRYLAVAWEMWLRDDFLVPYLNGEPYHHKPPLLFWLMQAGWAVFGVNDWWPGLVAPLFALASLWACGRLATLLWPNDSEVARLAPVFLVGTAFWAIFQTLTMFDMMLATCALAGISGVVISWRRGGAGGWILCALGIGVGVLAKGPAILLHVLPVALLAPWWGAALPSGPDRPFVRWPRWYLNVLLSVLGGAAIGLAWAVPAGIQGGEEYRNMIFWGQSAGRIVESFDHARPFWWYLAVLPPLLLPWLIWPSLWHGLRRYMSMADGAQRLLISWVVPALIVFSLISGKQLHYLLPEFAAFALLFGRAVSRRLSERAAVGRWDRVVLSGFFAAVGALIVALPVLTAYFREPSWFELVDTGWGGLLILAAGAIWIVGKASLSRLVAILAFSMCLIVVTIHLAAHDALKSVYDLRPMARALKAFEDQGNGLANFGYYHGQYQFTGRLTKPMAVLGMQKAETDAWIAANPDGIVVAYYYLKELPDFPLDAKPLASYRFRDFSVLFWPASLLERYPNLGNRS